MLVTLGFIVLKKNISIDFFTILFATIIAKTNTSSIGVRITNNSNHSQHTTLLSSLTYPPHTCRVSHLVPSLGGTSGQAGTAPVISAMSVPARGELGGTSPAGRSRGHLPGAPDGPPAPARTASSLQSAHSAHVARRCPSGRPGATHVTRSWQAARPAGRQALHKSTRAGLGLARLGRAGACNDQPIPTLSKTPDHSARNSLSFPSKTAMYSEFTNNVPLTPPPIRPLTVGSRWNRSSGGWCTHYCKSLSNLPYSGDSALRVPIEIVAKRTARGTL